MHVLIQISKEVCIRIQLLRFPQWKSDIITVHDKLTYRFSTLFIFFLSWRGWGWLVTAVTHPLYPPLTIGMPLPGLQHQRHGWSRRQVIWCSAVDEWSISQGGASEKDSLGIGNCQWNLRRPMSTSALSPEDKPFMSGMLGSLGIRLNWFAALVNIAVAIHVG